MSSAPFTYFLDPTLLESYQNEGGLHTDFEEVIIYEMLAIPDQGEEFIQVFEKDDAPSSHQNSSGLAIEVDTDSHFNLPSLEPSQYLQSFCRRTRSGERTRFRKDFYRMQHIRALKKSLRQHKQKKFPAASIHKVDPHNGVQTSLWTKLSQFYIQHEELLDSLSNPSPVASGNFSSSDDPRTCNNTYLRAFFASSVIQVYNYLFTELVFALDPANMCKKLKIECCEEATHGKECIDKWIQLKKFTQKDMIKEVRGEMEESVEREAKQWLAMKVCSSGTNSLDDPSHF